MFNANIVVESMLLMLLKDIFLNVKILLTSQEELNHPKSNQNILVEQELSSQTNQVKII
jgi:hypothetical protein